MQTAFQKLLCDFVQSQGHAALFVSCVVSMNQSASGSLIHSLDCSLIFLIGLAAVASADRNLKLLYLSFQCGPSGFVLHRLGLIDKNALFGRFNIRQTKHLLRWVKIFLKCICAGLDCNMWLKQMQLFFFKIATFRIKNPNARKLGGSVRVYYKILYHR